MMRCHLSILCDFTSCLCGDLWFPNCFVASPAPAQVVTVCYLCAVVAKPKQKDAPVDGHLSPQTAISPWVPARISVLVRHPKGLGASAPLSLGDDDCLRPILRDLARDAIKDLDDHSYELIMDVF